MQLLFWRLWYHLLSMRTYKYNPDFPWVASFLLVPHLPRLIGWKRRTAAANKQTYRQTQRKFIDRLVKFQWHVTFQRGYMRTLLDIGCFVMIIIHILSPIMQTFPFSD